MSRLQALALDALAPAQRELHCQIVADGSQLASGRHSGDGKKIPIALPDGSLSGPWNAMVASPVIGSLVEQTARACRHESRCARDLTEVAILAVGAEWRSQFEWFAHARLALHHGVSAAAISLIKRSASAAEAAADGAMDARQAAVYAWARELLATKRTSMASHVAALDAVGSEAALVDLTWTLGFYLQISCVLNAFDVSIPPGCGAAPFEEP